MSKISIYSLKRLVESCKRYQAVFGNGGEVGKCDSNDLGNPPIDTYLNLSGNATIISFKEASNNWKEIFRKDDIKSRLKPIYKIVREEGDWVEIMILEGRNFSKEYLTTLALEDGTISFNILKDMGTDLITFISYSLDDGKTWKDTQNSDDKQENIEISVNVKRGDVILWKGQGKQTGYYNEELNDFFGSFFSSTAEFEVAGNIMSILQEGNFSDTTELEEEGIFAYLFSKSKVKDSYNLILPATKLAKYCYYKLFYECSLLETIPNLPSKKLKEGCYGYMFSECTSLKTVRSIQRFEAAIGSCSYMYSNCTSLVEIPDFPFIKLADYCFGYMFSGCTSLEYTPNLPTPGLSNYCYTNMFSGCTSLKQVHKLPAQTLKQYCYSGMFSNCTSLEEAPELPATNLIPGCYEEMFSGCTALSFIKADFITKPSNSYTQNWVHNVSSDGLFIKNPLATWDVIGENGVPRDWDIDTEV